MERVKSFECRTCKKVVELRWASKVPAGKQYCKDHMPDIHIEFRQIDCKTDGYCPVYCHDKNNDMIITPNNYRISQELEKEYLERLDQLQTELTEKYSPLFAKESGDLSDKEIELVNKEVWGKSKYDAYGHLFYT